MSHTQNQNSQQQNISRQAKARACLYADSTAFMERRFGSTQIREPARPTAHPFVLDHLAPEEIMNDELRCAVERHLENPAAQNALARRPHAAESFAVSQE